MGRTRFEEYDYIKERVGSALPERINKIIQNPETDPKRRERLLNMSDTERERLIDALSDDIFNDTNKPMGGMDTAKRALQYGIKGTNYLNDIKNALAFKAIGEVTGKNVVTDEDLDKAQSLNPEEYGKTFSEYSKEQFGKDTSPRPSDLPLLEHLYLDPDTSKNEGLEMQNMVAKERPYPYFTLEKGGLLDPSIRDIGEFIVDTATDPLTWGPFMGAGVLAKILKSPKLAKTLKRLANPVSSVIETTGESIRKIPTADLDAQARKIGKVTMPSDTIKKRGYKQEEFFGRQGIAETLKKAGKEKLDELNEFAAKLDNDGVMIDLNEALTPAIEQAKELTKYAVTKDDGNKLLNILLKEANVSSSLPKPRSMFSIDDKIAAAGGKTPTLDTHFPRYVSVSEALRIKKAYQDEAAAAYKRLAKGDARSTEQGLLLSSSSALKEGIENQLENQVKGAGKKLQMLNDEVSSAYGAANLASKGAVKEAMSHLPGNVSIAEAVIMSQNPATGTLFKAAKEAIQSPKIMMGVGGTIEDLGKIPVWDALIRRNLRERVRTEADRERAKPGE